MHRGFCRAIPVFAILGLLIATNSAAESEMKFSEMFDAATLGDDVTVQVPDSVTLILDGARPYVLGARNLFVRAKKAAVQGNVTIMSFSEASVGKATEGTPVPPPPVAPQGVHGTVGATGNSGQLGQDAGVCVLDLGSLTVNAGSRLSVSMDGQKGGKGQKGGQGGQGGQGDRGTDAGDDTFCSNPCPGVGKKGFPGGMRGAGGPGGPGGAGGTIYRSESVGTMQSQGAILFTTQGGIRGDPGDPGEPGIGGIGGPRGSGSASCKCSDPPGVGPEGDAGPDNVAPDKDTTRGDPGKIVNLN